MYREHLQNNSNWSILEKEEKKQQTNKQVYFYLTVTMSQNVFSIFRLGKKEKKLTKKTKTSILFQQPNMTVTML